MNEPSKEELIFGEALILPLHERARYLDSACRGDAALRERVEVLLQAHDSAGVFMAPPREVSRSEKIEISPPTGPVDREGARIGRYKLLQKIGEGGCGVVWMAEQEEPVRRRVALKVIKLGMDTKNVIARFEAERQALALMDHPNIAWVLDAGATETGRPFFVMELVPGVPITKYCDQHNLSTAARLGLFTQVCQAVQHAHQKGIIHRDLKPSNILVTLHDGEPIPKVIDFGIAKATQGRLTDHTLFTAFEQFIGTPAYMSPEQAEMSGIDVDTRSDIYSLGVLLYELLTGRPPFDPKSLFQAGLDEIRRIIREVEPPKPSTRLNTLAISDRDSIARQRGIASAQLSLLLRGDLDWIVMKALEKNRNRRYETANGLALDIQRHLQNEPVSARPPTTGYRISRFIRRNRLTVAAISAVALALIIGTIISSAQAMRAKRAEHVANLERRKAIEERTRAEDLLGFMLGDLRTQLAKVGRLDVLEAVGDKAKAYFSARKAEEMEDPDLARYSKVLTQIGEIRMDQARYGEAASAFSEAYNYTSALVTRHPNNGDLLFERGQAEFWNGYIHWQKGEISTAAEWLNRYKDTGEGLVKLNSSNPEWQSELAHAHHNLGSLNTDRNELDRARAEFAAELSILGKLAEASPGDFDLRFRISDVHSWLADLSDQQGRLTETLNEYSTQAGILRQLVRDAPGTKRWRFLYANALLFEVDAATATGQYPLAQIKLKESQQLLNELTAFDSENQHWAIAQLNAQLKKAGLITHGGDQPAALDLVESTIPSIEALSKSAPSDRAFSRFLAKAYRMRAQLRFSLAQKDAAPAAKEALEIGEGLVRQGQMPNSIVGECASAYVVAGEILMKTDASAAKAHWQRALELAFAKTPQLPDWRLLDPAARATFFIGHEEEAIALIEKLDKLGYVPLEPWPARTKLSIPQPQSR